MDAALDTIFSTGGPLAPAQWLAIPIAWAWAAALEWGIHRYVFHGLGRKKGSPLSFHYADHHRACRENDGEDPAFAGGVFAWNAYGREALGLGLLVLLHAPLLGVAPLGLLTIALFALNYHRVHRRCHLHPEWARLHAPWHWDHHMGPGEYNWGVTTDWVDRLMGSRRPWTPGELEPDPVEAPLELVFDPPRVPTALRLAVTASPRTAPPRPRRSPPPLPPALRAATTLTPELQIACSADRARIAGG